MSSSDHTKAGIPTIKRMPLYLRLLRKMKTEGLEYASGTVVAQQLDIDPIVVRKDLAITGVTGRPRLGFPLDEIIEAIKDFLGWEQTSDAFLIGAGNLGTALLGYQGFIPLGMRIIAAFDSNPELIGQKIHGRTILDIRKLPTLASRMHVQLGILTTNETTAQAAADTMIEGGIRGIWNFTPVTLDVPDDVIVQYEELASSLAVLSHRLTVMNEEKMPGTAPVA